MNKPSDAFSEDPEKVSELALSPTAENGEVKDARFKHADPNDGDEALKAFAGHEGETIIITPEAEKALLRKIDFHIMPVRDKSSSQFPPGF